MAEKFAARASPRAPPARAPKPGQRRRHPGGRGRRTQTCTREPPRPSRARRGSALDHPLPGRRPAATGPSPGLWWGWGTLQGWAERNVLDSPMERTATIASAPARPVGQHSHPRSQDTATVGPQTGMQTDSERKRSRDTKTQRHRETETKTSERC